MENPQIQERNRGSIDGRDTYGGNIPLLNVGFTSWLIVLFLFAWIFLLESYHKFSVYLVVFIRSSKVVIEFVVNKSTCRDIIFSRQKCIYV